MNIIESLKWRYATKKFDTNKIIDSKKLEILKEAFNLTATSYGLQPVKLLVIKNKELQKRLVSSSMNQNQVAEASHVLVFCSVTEISSDYINTYFKRVKKIRNTPDTILKPFQDFLIEDFQSKTQNDIEDWTAKWKVFRLKNMIKF